MNVKTNKTLKPQVCKGYFRVGLYRNDEYKHFFVHRLVAEAFIPNPLNLPQVNHKNENKQDNRVENIEWISAIGNSNHGTRNSRISKNNTNGKLSKPVLQYSLDGKFIKEWSSVCEVQRQLGFHQSNISACCNGKRRYAHSFIWKYKGEE